jgi:hypothetical protein
MKTVGESEEIGDESWRFVFVVVSISGMLLEHDQDRRRGPEESEMNLEDLISFFS